MKGVEPDQNPPDCAETECVSMAGAPKALPAVCPPLPADADLRVICEAWSVLPEPIKAGILAMVKAAKA